MYLLVLCIGVLLSLQIYRAGGKVDTITDNLLNDKFPRLQLIAQMQLAVVDHERILYEYYATMDQDFAIKHLAIEQQKIIESITRLEQAFPEHSAVVMLDDYFIQLKSMAVAMDNTMSADRVDWDLAREHLVGISGMGRMMNPVLLSLADEIQTQALATGEQTRLTTRNTTSLVLGFSILVVAVAAWVGVFINRYINETTERRRLSMFVERNPDPVISTDWEGQVVYFNPATEYLLADCDLELSQVQSLLPSDLLVRLGQLKQTHSHDDYWEFEYRHRHISCSLSVLYDLRLCHLHLKDITESRQATDQLNFLAYHDSWTMLPNRYRLEEDVDQLIHRSQKPPQFALGLLSIDRFQLVAASNGNDIRDDLVAAASERLKAVLADSNSGTLYRLDSSHFGVLLRDFSVEQALQAFVEPAKLAFEEPFEVKGLSFYLSLSMGFSHYPEQGAELNKNAEAALARAIDNGGNQALVYSADMSNREQAWVAMEAALRQAFEQDQFQMYYQPQFDVTGNQLIGMEALIRWQQADGQFISPAEFIPVAEQTGMIVNMGQWILKVACEQAAHLYQSGLRDFVMAVNISARQFQHPKFLETVARIIDESQIDPAYIELEITESTIMQNIEHCIEILQQLKSLGLALAVDDFGTGYSSLSYLKRFPIDKLKIDQSFVRNLGSDKSDLAIVRAIIDLAHNLDLAVIAEGVETEQQRAMLEANRCEQIQGYLISKPMPAAQAVSFVNEKLKRVV
ncbi:putative bifunctional diguanylate cyclase/phosphodiesterase [Oceanicoccus sagamiensis]|uniref:cyclic-guanylate-specific phosphodiesterase n=1 Tax=Oceanicoccus sagamiensis TaxID=716816 RepID=A0A1X9ND53_9GAMM|nr:bifunctional diguanylate cyclase/phosphodiesterase [Oceanicoccus sagamiensis]ARN75978.1 hypothetical protein BST96_18885 [Oceanicoccus sagamiensis]